MYSPKRLTRTSRDRRGRLVCWCGGYWFPHRQGGGACDHSRTRDIHLAVRAGDEDAYMNALVAFFFDHPAPPALDCPF